MADDLGLLGDPWVNLGIGLLAKSINQPRPVNLGEGLIYGMGQASNAIESQRKLKDAKARELENKVLAEKRALEMDQLKQQIAEKQRIEQFYNSMPNLVVSPYQQAQRQIDSVGGGPLPENAGAGLTPQVDYMTMYQKMFESRNPALMKEGMEGVLAMQKAGQPRYEKVGDELFAIKPDGTVSSVAQAKPKAEWSDPFELGGATVQKNAKTGEIRTAVTRPPQIRVGGDSDTSLPKNFHQWAKELQTDYITKNREKFPWVSDDALASMRAGTSGAKAMAKGALADENAVKRAESQLGAFDAIERNLNYLYDPNVRSLRPEAKSIFGRVDQYRGPLLLSEESANALSALEGLKNQATMMNLADAKARVGQSFGSMQVKEWDKFVGLLTSMDRYQGEKRAAENLRFMNDFIGRHKDDIRNVIVALNEQRQGKVPGQSQVGAITPKPAASTDGWAIRPK